MINIYKQQLVGDAFSGRIGYLSRDLFTEWGNPLRAQFVAPPLQAQGRKLFQRSLWIDMETGTGSIIEPTIDPTEKVVLHLNGTDGSTIISDTNSGGDPHVWTAAGNAQIDTAESAFGGASLLLDGVGDFISTPDHADFTVSGVDWEFPIWFNCTAPAGTVRRIAGQMDVAETNAGSAWNLLRLNTNNLSASVFVGGVQFSVVGTTVFTDLINPGWNYVSLVCVSNVLKLFVNGTQEGGDVAVVGSINNSAGSLMIGSYGSGINSWMGWLDEVAFYIGGVKHTTSFIVPPFPPAQPTERAPQALLDWSDDGGHTFSTLQPPRSTGRLGEYRTRARWLQLGSFYQRTYRLTLPDPVRRSLMAAYGDGNGAPFEIEK